MTRIDDQSFLLYIDTQAPLKSIKSLADELHSDVAKGLSKETAKAREDAELKHVPVERIVHAFALAMHEQVRMRRSLGIHVYTGWRSVMKSFSFSFSFSHNNRCGVVHCLQQSFFRWL